jgi:peptidoglycan/LPS O-acetylase OafA/YrhL
VHVAPYVRRCAPNALIPPGHDTIGPVSTTTQRVRRIAGLDVIRGIAVALVLIRHAWPDIFGGAGIEGVVIFFGLSGYLITGLLASDITRYGRVRFARFYVHRFFRLVPPLILLLVVVAGSSIIWNRLGDRPTLPRDLAVAVLYLSDLPGVHTSPALVHLWTLAVEEQFYLVWPTLLLVSMRLGRSGVVVVTATVGLLAVCGLSLVEVRPDYERVYMWPSSWAVAMMIGAAAYLYRERLQSQLFDTGAKRFSLRLVSVLALAAISVIPEAKKWPGSYLLLGPLIAVLTLVLILWLREWSVVPSAALLPILWLGRISYAAYLWDFVIVRLLHPNGNPTRWQGVMSIPITVAVATFSYFTVERWAGRARNRLEPRLVKTPSVGGHAK